MAVRADMFPLLLHHNPVMISTQEQPVGSDTATSFAVDTVRRLGASLDTLQDREEWAQTDSSRAVVHQHSKTDPSQAVVDVINCTSLHSPKQLQVALQVSGEEELMNVARVTYAACGVVLDRLLEDAERVNDQAWYWTQIEEDVGRTVVYLVQSEWTWTGEAYTC